MTLDNMTGITEGSYTGFCKSQLITCNFVKACNGVGLPNVLYVMEGIMESEEDE